MKEEFRVHAQKSSEFQQKVSTAIFGDKDAEILGLAKRVKDAENYIDEDKKFKAKVAGGLFISIPIFGAVWEWVKHKFNL